MNEAADPPTVGVPSLRGVLGAGHDRRIWSYRYVHMDNRFRLWTPSPRRHRLPLFSTAQLCKQIQRTCCPIRSLEVDLRRADLDEEEWAVLGAACCALERLERLSVDTSLDDKRASRFLLRLIPHGRIEWLHIKGDGERSVKSTLRLLHRFSSLRILCLEGVRLHTEDCAILGQALGQLPQLKRLKLLRCSLGTFSDWLILVDGMHPNLPVTCDLSLTTAVDQTIPADLTAVSDQHKVFYVLLGRHSSACNNCFVWFERAANEHMSFHRAMHQAGWNGLIANPENASHQQWVNALAHDSVRCKVDCLYHLLTMYPSGYALAALEALTSNQNATTTSKSLLSGAPVQSPRQYLPDREAIFAQPIDDSSVRSTTFMDAAQDISRALERTSSWCPICPMQWMSILEGPPPLWQNVSSSTVNPAKSTP